MKPQELRNGNIILVGNNTETVEYAGPMYMYVATKGIENSIFSIFPYDIIQPISLTEQILVDACGFELSYTEGCRKYFEKNIMTIVLPEDEIFRLHIKSSGIKYLHQLQNLYLDITGEELNINTEKIQL